MESPSLPAPPLVSARARSVKRKAGRPTKAATRGRKARFTALMRAGELQAALAWHKTWNLAAYGIPAPALPPSAPPAASPDGPDTASGSHGGEGVDQRLGRGNWDKTTQNGQNSQYGCKTTPATQNSQCSPVATADAVPLAVEADLTRLAAKADCTPTVTPPTGESEGDSQKVKTITDTGSRLASMWPEGGEGIVGKVCRNKQYNELRVVGENGELWTKVGNWLWTGGLVRGERVLVNRVWVSGDDTDAEYEVVRRLDVNEGPNGVPVQPQPESGSDSGSESMPQVQDVIVANPPSVVSKTEIPKAILPQFQREEPDYPRKQESAEDYISRIRAEAAMWANGQGR